MESKNLTDEVKKVLKMLDANTDIKELSGEEDYDDDCRCTVETISEDLEFYDDEEEIYISVHAYASGRVTKDRGDYYTPPSSETNWGELELDELVVEIADEEIEISDEAYDLIIEKIRENIDF